MTDDIILDTLTDILTERARKNIALCNCPVVSSSVSPDMNTAPSVLNN